MPTLVKAFVPALALLFVAGCGGQEQTAPSCSDRVVNGSETDVDCGGGCSRCLDGKRCGADTDCVGGRCAAGVCDGSEPPVPTCRDGAKNGEETDIDCGGGACPACGIGKACKAASDCSSAWCAEGVCGVEPAPTCVDATLNGMETDVDCGGLCPGCDEGERCLGDGDCGSNVCGPSFACVPSLEGCFDERINGKETGVDCGRECPPCPDGSFCEEAIDCLGGICDRGICNGPPTGGCANGIRDGYETDIDCGGEHCQPCPTGYRCLVEGDCPDLCIDEICGGPEVCWDGTLNGRETAIDCGGGVCRDCLAGKRCLVDDDCVSNACDADNLCTEPADFCDNGVVDGDETDLDCGGSLCPPCPDGYYCRLPADCESGICFSEPVFPAKYACQTVNWDRACRDGVLDGHETGVDCGGSLCEPCPAGRGCVEDSDCQSLSCSNGQCDLYAPTCGNGGLDGSETDLDCGGPGCVPCEEGRLCAGHRDCASGGCVAGECGASIPEIQAGAQSVGCSASGITTVREVKVGGVYVASPAFEVEAGMNGFYVQLANPASFVLDTRNEGILVVAPAVLTGRLASRDEVRIVGSYRERDCVSELYVGSQGSRLEPTGERDSVYATLISPSLLENGGGASVEPYESVLVVTDPQPVTALSDPANPGSPAWWFKVGNGIHVANDFDLQVPLQLGQVVEVTGQITQRQGLYLIVPRSADDLDFP